jgi:hypothetical protein
MNGIFAPRQVFAYLGNLGSSLPGAVAQHRGNFYWKRASGAEDELYAGVKDSSGVNQLRRILTEEYADTLYDPEAIVQLLYRTSTRWIVRHTVPDPNATTWQTSLMGAPTVTASATTNTDNATGPQIQLTTSNVSGNVALIELGVGAFVRGDWNWDFEVIAAAGGTITSVRYWIGLFSSAPSGSDDPSGVTGAGFHFNPASSANWRAWSNDGSSTGAFTDTNVVVATTSTTRFRLRSDATNIQFYINDVLVATHSSQHPSASLYHEPSAYCTTLSAATRSIRVGRFSVAHDR